MITPQKYSFIHHHHECGMSDGTKWAKTADMVQLEEEAGRTTLNELKENGTFTSSDDWYYSPLLASGSSISTYFVAKFESCDDYQLEAFMDADSGEAFQIPNEAFRAYHEGWVDAVNAHIKQLQSN